MIPNGGFGGDESHGIPICKKNHPKNKSQEILYQPADMVIIPLFWLRVLYIPQLVQGIHSDSNKSIEIQETNPDPPKQTAR